MKYILSIDGGGVRGIIPALALEKLEQTAGRLTRDIFSFVAGTSTGALIASAVVAGVPAARIVDLYRKRIGEIFRPSKPWSDLRRYTTGFKYDPADIHRLLHAEFGAAAEWRLNDSPVDLLLTAVGLADGKPWYFVRDSPANSQVTGNLRLVDCATASAAAPTYFAPWRMDAPVHGKLVDGGVGVTGNPVYQACVEAFCYSPGYRPAESVVVSLGTGRFVKRSDPRLLNEWLGWILDVLLHAPGEQQTDLVSRHYSAAPFYRLDPLLEADADLDDLGSIRVLDDTGRMFCRRVDWVRILAGGDSPFRMRPQPAELDRAA